MDVGARFTWKDPCGLVGVTLNATIHDIREFNMATSVAPSAPPVSIIFLWVLANEQIRDAASTAESSRWITPTTMLALRRCDEPVCWCITNELFDRAMSDGSIQPHSEA